MSAAVFSRIPGQRVVEPKPLVVRVFNNKQYYWNFSSQSWKRLTKRCPYLN